MATSRQWRHAGLLLGATLVVLLIGSADAWDNCPSGYKTCKQDYKNGCETCVGNDVDNCGDCGNKCKELPYTTVKCSNGNCQYTCTPGWADCDNNMYSNGCEKEVGNDDNNCGWCGNKCKELPYTTVKCNNGQCQYTCTPGWADCDNNMYSNGCEKEVDNDVNNCGWCGNKCKELPYTTVKCNNGQCQYTCTPGWADCDYNLYSNGCEKEVGNDVNNCGWCGNKCKELPYTTVKCNNGQCQYTCMPGWADCDNNMYSNGCEKEVGNDVNNCGWCGNKCKELPYTTVKCNNGQCDYTCVPGWADCDNNLYSNGCSKEVGNDVNNCGWCGNKCKELPYTTVKCNNGQCDYTCTPGWADCDNNMYSNGCEKEVGNDVNNCGWCGKQCPVTLKGGEATCSNGNCGQQCKQGNKYDQASNCCVQGY